MHTLFIKRANELLRCLVNRSADNPTSNFVVHCAASPIDVVHGFFPMTTRATRSVVVRSIKALRENIDKGQQNQTNKRHSD